MNEYVVESGDTLGIVTWRLFGSMHTWQEWAEFAGIDPHNLWVGQRIRYPGWWTRRGRLPLDKRDTGYFKFGDRYPPGRRWAGRPHPGVDFHEQEGAPVYAVTEGVVEVAKEDEGGYGFYTMLKHMASDGREWWSLYGHLAYPAEFPVGAAISGHNVVIGYEGKTGAAGGLSHVHFELKKDGGLGRLGELTEENYRSYYANPYMLEVPAFQFMSVQCWDCPYHRKECVCSG